ALPFLELLLIRGPGERLVELQSPQHVQMVDRFWKGRLPVRGTRRLVSEAFAHRREDVIAEGERAVLRVGARDDDPRRLGSGSLAHEAFAHLEEFLVRRLRLLAERLEALLLLLLGDVEPVLEKQHAL